MAFNYFAEDGFISADNLEELVNGGKDESWVQPGVIEDLIQEVDGVKGDQISYEKFKEMMLKINDQDKEGTKTKCPKLQDIRNTDSNNNSMRPRFSTLLRSKVL